MSIREEKWNEIKQEYHTHNMPKEQVELMKKNMNKAKKGRHRVIRTIAAAAAAAAIIITILPNASQSAAYAMSRIPILSKWVEVITFRDYQYEDERNSANINVPEIVTNVPQTDTSAKETVQKTVEEINTEIEEISKKLIAEFEENLENETGYQDMQITSEILATTEKYFTLKLICYQAAGSGAEWNHFYTIDLETGNRVTLKDFFLQDSDYITPISENIIEQMKTQMESDENICYWVDSDMPEWNFKEITDETGFYLNENDELVICFNEGDVAPMYMGCVEFVIPKEVLTSIWAK